MARLTISETSYLTEQFAERRDWPALWELAKDLPVLDAVEAVHQFDGWRRDGTDGALFDTLARVDLDKLEVSHQAVAEPWRVRLRMPGTVRGGSMAPGGQHVAVATKNLVAVFTFHHGAAPHKPQRRTVAGPRAVLMLDGGLLVIAGKDRWGYQAEYDEYGLSTYGYLERGSGKMGNHTGGLPRIVALDRTADGFAALVSEPGGHVLLHLQADNGGAAFRHQPHVRDVRDDLGISTKIPHRRWTMATNPGSGRIAFAGDNLYLAEMTTGLRRIAMAPFQPGPSSCLAFAGRTG
jgi:hypothetical protein